MRIIFFIIALSLLPVTGHAQQYQQWNNPDSKSPGDTRLKDFSDRLGGLIDKAEKDRAADPRFLRDLRDLAAGFGKPTTALLLSDDFADGDYTANPAWTVTQGQYWVEKGWGLRSAVKQEAQPEQRRSSSKDAAAAIFGQILQQVIDPEGQRGGTSTSSGGVAAAIRTAASIGNAFTLEMEFSSWKAEGRLEIAVYQDTADYVLAYQPGGTYQLLKASPRGSNVIDTGTGPALENKKTHRLQWVRRADGRMSVTIDGKQILTATDRSTTAPFDGLRLVNRGGDYIIKRITINGTK